MLPAILSSLVLQGKRSAIGPQTIWQHICCQAFIPFWKCVAMPPKHFPFCGCCGNYSSMCIIEYEREESKRRAVLLSGRARAKREETHVSFFFFLWNFCEQKGSTHRRLAVDLLHTQWWLSAKQWVTEIDMLLQRLVHIHPLHQSHLGRLVLPRSASPLVRIQSGCFSWIKMKYQPCNQLITAESNNNLLREKYKTNEESKFCDKYEIHLSGNK